MITLKLINFPPQSSLRPVTVACIHLAAFTQFSRPYRREKRTEYNLHRFFETLERKFDLNLTTRRCRFHSSSENDPRARRYEKGKKKLGGV